MPVICSEFLATKARETSPPFVNYGGDNFVRSIKQMNLNFTCKSYEFHRTKFKIFKNFMWAFKCEIL